MSVCVATGFQMVCIANSLENGLNQLGNYFPVAPVLNTEDVAKLAKASGRTIQRLHSSGQLPKPITVLGEKIVRWRAADILQWLGVGFVQAG